jgi:hypothetical protein
MSTQLSAWDSPHYATFIFAINAANNGTFGADWSALIESESISIFAAYNDSYWQTFDAAFEFAYESTIFASESTADSTAVSFANDAAL